MLLQLLKDTNYKGFKKAGEILDVSNDIARRWFKNGIASPYAKEVEVKEEEIYTEIEQIEDVVPVNTENENEEVEETEVKEEEQAEEKPMEEMNAKELYKLCCEKGLEVEPKKSKEYYLEMLTAP
jgi:hypothetical protein